MYTLTILVGFCLCSISYVSCVPVKANKKNCNKKDLYARCDLVPNPNKPSKISGKLYFMQPVTSDCRYDFLSVQVNVNNIPKFNFTKMHGLHVHEYGDMSNGCESMGGHYNPFGNTHGSPWHPLNARHVGDLGNFRRRDRKKSLYGKIKNRHVDYMARLFGDTSIVGRGIVFHADEDDLGLKRNDPESLITGNAGGRLACCIIGTSRQIETKYFTLYR